LTNLIFGLSSCPAEVAKRIYETQLRDSLETDHFDEFVARDPKSGAHFVGKEFIDAALAAKSAFPDCKPFVMRIGHEAAFHIGASST